jgi:hypothetical protein
MRISLGVKATDVSPIPPDQQLVKVIEKRIHRRVVVRLEDERSRARASAPFFR